MLQIEKDRQIKMKVLSLYCGGGGIDEGLRQAGIKTTLAIDIDKDCLETIKLNHPDTETICGRVGDYVESLKGFDIIVGGPPCQTFSYNNYNRKNDFTEVNTFIRIIEKIKPKLYLMENVMALYKLFDYGMKYKINCGDYGVPQKRKRVFYTNLPIPQPELKLKNTSDIINYHGFKYIFKSGNTHQKRKIRTKDVDDQCDTITASDRMYFTNHQIILEKYGFNFDVPKQELMISEIAQLQGFPKDYEFYGSLSSQRKQIGNAVPPPVIKAFFNQKAIQIFTLMEKNTRLII